MYSSNVYQSVSIYIYSCSFVSDTIDLNVCPSVPSFIKDLH